MPNTSQQLTVQIQDRPVVGQFVGTFLARKEVLRKALILARPTMKRSSEITREINMEFVKAKADTDNGVKAGRIDTIIGLRDAKDALVIPEAARRHYEKAAELRKEQDRLFTDMAVPYVK